MQIGIERFNHYVDSDFWQRVSVRITAAAGVALLMLGLLLPERFAAPLIGIGVAALLAVRLFAMGPVRGSAPADGSTVEARGVVMTSDGGADDAAPPRAAVDGRWHSALVDDALDDSFPASDPPSWSALRTGGPATGARVAGAMV